MDIQTVKQNIDLVSVVESAGVDVQKQGPRHVAKCTFHADNKPSLFIFPDNHFKCFGCSEHGDVIDFVQKFYGLSFQDALKHLGIETGELSEESKQEIARRKRERREVEGFKAWEQAASAELHLLISAAKKVLAIIKTPSDLDQAGPLFHNLKFWEHCLDILINGDDREKTRLYMDSVVTGEYQEDRLFNDNFDFKGWLRKFQKKGNADEWTINLHFAGSKRSSQESLTAG